MKKNYLLFFFLLVAISSYAQENTDTNASETIAQNNSSSKSEEIKDLRVFPNPVTSGILRINTFENAEKTIQIFDVLGKQVLHRKIKTQHINVSNLNSGIYILKVSENGKTATRKLVIK